MPKFTDERIALIALIAFGLWLFGFLPLFYLPSLTSVHGELLDVRYGEWLMFVATVGLWYATWRLVTRADKTAEQQLRAYVSIETGGVAFLGERSGIGANVVFRNGGQTPAHRFKTWTYLNVGDVNLPNPYPTPPLRSNSSLSVCGPGQTFKSQSFWVPTAEEMEAIRNKTKAIFFSGIAEYVDAFDLPRHFIFRCRMTGSPFNFVTQNGTSQLGWELTPDPLGYDAN